MKELRFTILCGALLLAADSLPAQLPPVTCTANAPAPTLVRSEGNAELVSDLILTCTGGNPAATIFLNMSLFLNTNVTSNLTGPGPNETEALVMIDEPKPSPAANTSNGFVFLGQVKGTSGAVASGNVFTGLRTGAPNELQWLGVPLVPPGAGTRRFRFTNLRAVPIPAGTAPTPILAFIAVSGSASVSINNPTQTMGFSQPGLKFTSSIAGPVLQLKFSEQFASAFKKRIENTNAGPTTAVKQDLPGFLHCTESGLNPDFTTTTPGDTGSANTGTRLAVKVTGIPFGIANLLAPNSVTSPSGQLVIQRIAPPYGVNLSGGVMVLGGGVGAVPVVAGAATLLYEVVARAPFAGVNGCAVLDSFTFTAHSMPGLSLAGAKVVGSFAPLDPTTVISGPAPEPRFN